MSSEYRNLNKIMISFGSYCKYTLQYFKNMMLLTIDYRLMSVVTLIRALLGQRLGRLRHLMRWRTLLRLRLWWWWRWRWLLRLGRILGERSETRLSLPTLIGHDATKEIAGAVTDGRRSRPTVCVPMAWETADADMRWWPSSSFKLVSESRNIFLISGLFSLCSIDIVMEPFIPLLDELLRPLQFEDLLPYHFHLLHLHLH